MVWEKCGEAQDGRPLATAVGLPDDLPVQKGSGLGGLKVMMEVEVLDIGGLVAAAQVGLAGGWLPLGGEEESGVVLCGIKGRPLDLLKREVRHGDGCDGEAGVAELWMLELCRGWPCGEDFCVRKSMCNEANGLLMKDDHVAVGEVVLGSEGVGRIETDGGHERGEGEGSHSSPEADMAAPLYDTDQKN